MSLKAQNILIYNNGNCFNLNDYCDDPHHLIKVEQDITTASEPYVNKILTNNSLLKQIPTRFDNHQIKFKIRHDKIRVIDQNTHIDIDTSTLDAQVKTHIQELLEQTQTVYHKYSNPCPSRANEDLLQRIDELEERFDRAKRTLGQVHSVVSDPPLIPAMPEPSPITNIIQLKDALKAKYNSVCTQSNVQLSLLDQQNLQRLMPYTSIKRYNGSMIDIDPLINIGECRMPINRITFDNTKMKQIIVEKLDQSFLPPEKLEEYFNALLDHQYYRTFLELSNENNQQVRLRDLLRITDFLKNDQFLNESIQFMKMLWNMSLQIQDKEIEECKILMTNIIKQYYYTAAR